jgi:deoxyribose-phosphate aldolase
VLMHALRENLLRSSHLARAQFDTIRLRPLKIGARIAAEYRVGSFCVRPGDVKLAAGLLAGSGVRVITVIGFPHGSTTTAAKVAESIEAMENGAVELDMVLHIGKLRGGDLDYVREDIRAVTFAAHERNVAVKVIFETCHLSDEQIVTACKICNEALVDFVKTSTGTGTRGASDNDLRLMRAHCDERIQVKASGGILTLEGALEVRRLGCSRFGCPQPVGILERLVRNDADYRCA